MRNSALFSCALAALLLSPNAGWGGGFGGAGFGGGGFGGGGFGGGGFGGGFGRGFGGGFGHGGRGGFGRVFLAPGMRFGRYGGFGIGRGGFGFRGFGRFRGGSGYYYGWYPWWWDGYSNDQQNVTYAPAPNIYVRPAPQAPARPPEFGKFVSAPRSSTPTIASAHFGCRHGRVIRLQGDQRPATMGCVSP